MKTNFLWVVCQLGAENAVKDELATRHPECRLAFSRPGFLTFKNPAGVDEDVVLQSVFVRAYGASVGRARDPSEVVALLEPVLPAQIPVRLHVFERDVAKPGDEPGGFSYGVLAKGVRERIAHAWPSDRNAVLPGEEALPGELVIDVVVAGDEAWWVGVHRHGPQHSPWAGGRIPVEVPAEAPSRAYRKLEEALRWSGAPVQAGDVAVELGSAPGGASYALLQRGLRVFGVDPAEMDARVTSHPGGRFTHLQRQMGQVSRRDLPPTLHWILMDVNMAPQVALNTVQRLAAAPRDALMGVLLTLKLDDWKAVRHVPRLLERIRALGMAEVRATQLPSNRMELFAYGLTEHGVRRLKAL